MPPTKHILIAVAVGLVAGFILANAPTGTGIYKLPFGQTLADIYTAGHDLKFTTAQPVTATA